MPPLDPPFRADHVGSLLRPASLIEARDAFDAGKLEAAALRALEDQCIRDVVRLQEDAGLRSITDGEFRRRSFWLDFLNCFSGITIEFEAADGWDFVDEHGHRIKAPKAGVQEKIEWMGPGASEEFAFLKSIANGTPKVTIPSPTMVHYYGGRANISEAAYPDLDGFWDDMTTAYRAAVEELFEAGCRYIQIDETTMAKLCDDNIRGLLEQRGDDPDALLATYADAVNAIIADRPADLTIAVHLCRGNQRGYWQASGGYDYVADVLFNRVQANAYFLEFDTPRAGTFAPLNKLPADKVAVLGLISTKKSDLEDRDALLARIDEAAKVIPLDQICISPQCGFSSGMYGNPITHDDQQRKLELLVSVAAEVWGA